MKNKKTVRKYYALHWKDGCAFEYDYDTIPELGDCVAYVIAFKTKKERDYYVDRWHNAESIPYSIAHKLVKYLGFIYNEEG